EREAEMRAVIEPWTQERSAEEVTALLQGAGVPAAPVNNFEQLLKVDPALKERALWTEVEHPELGVALVERWGFRLPKAPAAPHVRAPLLGEHTDHVFQDIVGLSEDEVNDLLVEGVFR